MGEGEITPSPPTTGGKIWFQSHESGRDDQPLPRPSTPVVGKRACPEVMRVEELAQLLTGCSTHGRAGPAPQLGSTIDLTLLAGAQVNLLGQCKTRKANLVCLPPLYAM